MLIKEIKLDIPKIKTIYHIADVHVRNLKRHKEYREQFNKVADVIKQDTENAIIYIAGDIFHSKVDISPESVNLVGDFLRMMADIAPTIIIAGNHDCNLNNNDRLDAITPVVSNLNHPNLYYLKDSGVYRFNGINFTVLSVWDKPVDYIKAKDINLDGLKIALYHGAVNKSQTDTGTTIRNEHVTTDIFNGYDLALLGDIHRRQFLDDAKTICYAGSTIQQNHGEDISHGIMKWDTSTLQSEYIEIPNDYCYVTLNVDNGKIITPSTQLPSKPRIRLKVENTSKADLKNIISDIKSQYNVQDVSVQNYNNKIAGTNILDNKINLGDIRDVEYQNELITEYLETKFDNLDDKLTDAVRHINRITNSKKLRHQVIRNVIWKPIYFKFDNMFSYGVDNYINFETMNGTYGIFAANASGKSTLFDAIAFTCYDKCSRTTKAAHVLNNKENSFFGEFCFELNGFRYFIKRDGIKMKTGHVKVLVNFWMEDETGMSHLLNGEERDETNKIIRSYLGEYDDFVLTALSLQNNNTSFIEMGQRERKELLSKFLDIGVFEDLYKLASEDIKEVAALLKRYQRDDFSSKLADASKRLGELRTLAVALSEAKESLTSERDIENEKLIGLSTKLVPVNLKSTDIKLLEKTQLDLMNAIQTADESRVQCLAKIDSIVAELDTLKTSMASYNKKEIVSNINTYYETDTRLRNLKQELTILNNRISDKQSKLDKLSEHKYDPNCEYCINNVFVKDAIDTEKSINDDIAAREQLEARILLNTSVLNEYKIYDTLFANLTKLESDITAVELKESKARTELASIELEISKLNDMYTTTTTAISDYHNMQDVINANGIIETQILNIRSRISTLNDSIKDTDNKILVVAGEIQVSERIISECNESITELRRLEIEYQGYEKYLDAVSRDGVPYWLVSKAIPKIENEINNILTQMVDFNVMLETDGKNINAYIVYDDDNFWPIELTSGMERFISSLAIRSALISVSSLPRPNFMCVDEGFGALDSDKLSSIFLLLDYLKSQFDFVMTISHIDSMRDIVDKLVSINKVDNYSKINYT